MPDTETLLLMGHGSTRYPEAGRLLHVQAEQLRAAGHEVRVAFLNGSPSVQDAMADLGGTVVRIVPCFMEDGYFTRIAIPRALNGVTADRSKWHVVPPIGVHPGMPELIRRQAIAACQNVGLQPRQTAVLLIGHGSASAPGQHLALHDHTARIAAERCFARVVAACLEEPPFVADVLAQLRAYPVMALGYFANLGGHMRDDVPALLQAERTARASLAPGLHFAGCVAEEAALSRIILDQAQWHQDQGGTLKGD